MRVESAPEFVLDLESVPDTVALWALGWLEAAKSPDFTIADMTAGAQILRSESGNVYSRRRRGHRLIFRTSPEKNEVMFVAVRKREDVYEVAAARIGERH